MTKKKYSNQLNPGTFYTNNEGKNILIKLNPGYYKRRRKKYSNQLNPGAL